MYAYTVTTEELTAQAQLVKQLILQQLVEDGHMTEEEANDWAASRGILCHNKFMLLWNWVFDKDKSKQQKRDEISGVYYTLVKR